MVKEHDFRKGSIPRNIMNLAIPMTLAQLINVLYNIIDRVYIGRLPDVSGHALAGLGITFPIITLILAFANLVGMGGAPLFSIERGKQKEDQAERIMSNSMTLLLIFGIALSILCFAFKKDILYLFGASDVIYPYANDYLSIYLWGTIFVMISLGMNSFINAQGFGKIGMLTVLIGALLNLILDPLFIFYFDMGVKGAAIATVISQGVSAIWVLCFLCNQHRTLRIHLHKMKLELSIVKNIISLGMSGFVMSITNSSVQIVCNTTLQQFGGDVYIGIMTIINSLREVITMPLNGITNGSQPIMSYNYGAKLYERVLHSIRFMSTIAVVYMVVLWILVFITPELCIRIFNDDAQMIRYGIPAIQVYYFGYFMMAFQFSGQSTFVALNKSKQAVFFSLFRKVIIVIPLTLWLPHMGGLGVYGVFLAEPISNFIGGSVCYLTMYKTLYQKLKKKAMMLEC